MDTGRQGARPARRRRLRVHQMIDSVAQQLVCAGFDKRQAQRAAQVRAQNVGRDRRRALNGFGYAVSTGSAKTGVVASRTFRPGPRIARLAFSAMGKNALAHPLSQRRFGWNIGDRHGCGKKHLAVNGVDGFKVVFPSAD